MLFSTPYYQFQIEVSQWSIVESLIFFFLFLGIFKLLCRLREQVLRELGFRDIFKKVKVNVRLKIRQGLLSHAKEVEFTCEIK